MFYLAQVTAKRRNLACGTGDAASWSVLPFFSEAANFDEYTIADADGYYSALLFDEVVPSNIAEVPMGEIVRFVERRRDERLRFRQMVQSFSQQLAGCESNSHCDTICADFRFEIQDACTTFRRSMGPWGNQQRSSILTVGLPVAAGVFTFAAADGNPFTFSKLIGSVSIGAVAAYVDYQRARALATTDKPSSYLVDINRRLVGSRHASNRYADYFDEFIND